jgi:hypothetical protein
VHTHSSRFPAKGRFNSKSLIKIEVVIMADILKLNVNIINLTPRYLLLHIVSSVQECDARMPDTHPSAGNQKKL